MSADTFTEVTKKSWFSRIGGAIKGILAGILLGFARALGEFGATLMVAGSIARSYKSDRKNSGEMRRILRPCVEDVWDFGQE